MFHLTCRKYQQFHSCYALVKLLIFSTHSMKYIWYSPQNIPFICFRYALNSPLQIKYYGFRVGQYETSQYRPKLHKAHISVFALRIQNTELNDLRKNICLRKYAVSIKRLCIVIEKLAEHGIHYMPCSRSRDVIYILP